MLLSGPDRPTTLNVLPDDFLCLLPASRIVPRATNFIAGPLRTADVKQAIQLGAHGSRRLHVLRLGDASG